GICGEHGGDPSSVEFCHRAGMTYVSCSPYSVPVAWMAAAQAQLAEPRPTGPPARPPRRIVRQRKRAARRGGARGA
ncbi:MAG TPA: putative PEP-binding protein, partial [Pseudomonadales bacterium]|nr:putative PEP-binding protein [Pseudomonadales bacterium]